MDINILGDSLSVRLYKSNDFTNVDTVETLQPPITGMSAFRILCNHVCELYISFAYNSAVMDENGQLSETRTCIAGQEDIWYNCSDYSIFRPIVALINPPPDVAPFESIDILFQFASQVPDNYRIIL
jgi:hypothetical protein